MATDIFTGGPSGSPLDWSDDAAWSAGGPPAVGDDVEMSGAGIVDVAYNSPVDYLGTVTLDAGAVLTFPGGSADNDQLWLSGLDLGAGAVLNIGDSTGDIAQVILGITATAPLDAAGATINIGPHGYLSAYTDSASGTVNITGEGEYSWSSNGGPSTQTVNVGTGLFQIAVPASDTSNFNGQITGLAYSGNVTVELAGVSPNLAATTIDTASNSITLAFGSGPGETIYTLDFNPATDPVSDLNISVGTDGTVSIFDIGLTAAGTPSATDVFTGGPSGSPITWSTDSAWSAGAPPGTNDLVEMSGSGTLNTSTHINPFTGMQQELIGGLTLSSGAQLALGVFDNGPSLEVTGTATGGSSFGGAGSLISLYFGYLNVDAGVTSTTGTVSLDDYSHYTLSGSGSTQIINATDLSYVTIDGQNNDSTINASDGTQVYIGGTDNNLTINLSTYFGDGITPPEVSNIYVDSPNNSGVINIQGGGQIYTGAYGGKIENFYSNSEIYVYDQYPVITGALPTSYSTSLTNNTITFNFNNGDSNTLQFDPASTPVSQLVVTTDSDFFFVTSTIPSPICFCSGTQIATPAGEVPVETLTVGDRVLTASGAARPIVWIGSRILRNPSREQWPVRVSAGTFGENRPARDLWLSPGHAVCLSVVDEVFVPVGELINGATIAQVEVPQVTYWHVELETHDVLLAEGLPTESYMDAGNRAWFAGRDGAADPERVEASLELYARPFVNDPATTAIVRRRLAARAERFGWTLTADMDLHLVVDGKRVDPVIDGDVAAFVFQAQAKAARLVSRTFSPAWTGQGEDQREMGVCLQSLRIGDGHSVNREVPLDALDGFHLEEAEAGDAWRWTTGDLALPATLWADCDRSVLLLVRLAPHAGIAWLPPQTAVADNVVPLARSA